MAKDLTHFGAASDEYLIRLGTRETELMARLRAETATLPMAGMQIGPDQGALLAMLVRLTGARRIVEIGTFTGYSALAMASALPTGGRLHCCDVDAEWTAIGQRYWREAGLDDRIDLQLAPALETVAKLEARFGRHSFDMAFIDADKPNYDGYYEACLRLVRPGGLIAIDNVLWSGAVADPADQSDSTVALRALNEKLHTDPRVDLCLVPIGDGVSLVRPR